MAWGRIFCGTAEDGLHAQLNNTVTAGCGGLATAESHQLQQFVTFDLVTPCKQAILLHLDGLPFGPLGLLNVYGPNDSCDRAALWESLANLVDPSCPWLVWGGGTLTWPYVHPISLGESPLTSLGLSRMLGHLCLRCLG
jgi:hypothetical protein